MIYDDLLDELSNRGAAALLEGFSLGQDDDLMTGFHAWMARRYPAEGGHPNPVTWQVLLAEDLFGKRPHEFDDGENESAVVRMCELVRGCRNSP